MKQHYRNLTVTFDVDAYPRSSGFEFPKNLAKALELGSGDAIALSINRLSGELLFVGIDTLTSGTEVTHKGKKLSVSGPMRNVKPRDKLRITASRPPKKS